MFSDLGSRKARRVALPARRASVTPLLPLRPARVDGMIHPGDFVSLLTVPGITKGVVLHADGYFVRVQWIIRSLMEGKVSTHREEDLYKLAYRVSP
jgi:hypothetical protein